MVYRFSCLLKFFEVDAFSKHVVIIMPKGRHTETSVRDRILSRSFQVHLSLFSNFPFKKRTADIFLPSFWVPFFCRRRGKKANYKLFKEDKVSDSKKRPRKKGGKQPKSKHEWGRERIEQSEGPKRRKREEKERPGCNLFFASSSSSSFSLHAHISPLPLLIES